MKLIILLMLLLAASVVVSGAGTVPKAYEPNSSHMNEPGQCRALMVNELYLATDTSSPLQNQHLMAADAYRQLSDELQRC